jgi:ribosomal protein S18 acetylase RimI-like enzyme
LRFRVDQGNATANLLFFYICFSISRVMSPSNVFKYPVLGKVEGKGKSWHGHVTAVTVAPTYRRQGLAKKLMDILEDVTTTV